MWLPKKLVAGRHAATLGRRRAPRADRIDGAGLVALAAHDAVRQAVDDGYSTARAAGASRHDAHCHPKGADLGPVLPAPGDGLGIAGDEVLIVADDVAAAAIGLSTCCWHRERDW